ncbi:MAG: glycosyltransferase [Flavobacterium sp.]|nr:glycosyltransferase [Flavobacterium sp.]
MRILQIIDSLDVGGAEKMAVNYANSLADKVEFSGLVTTRKEGYLKIQLNDKVPYLFLNRKRRIDISAILRLRDFCKENKIEYLQPHSFSYFTALLVKFTYPKLKIIWHDHYGLSEFLSKRKLLFLKMSSFFFHGIIAVNFNLKNWAIKRLHCKKVIYLPNYTKIDQNIKKETVLKGVEGKKILCLANLRHQKNHFLLLEVAGKLKESNPDWTFHLVGNDSNDDYSDKLKQQIVEKGLENNVFIYGTKNDTVNIIQQSEITILTSNSEGLPVALIEYGLLSKPTVTTNVGEIPLIITNAENGFVVAIKDASDFYKKLSKLINDESLRIKLGQNLNKTILEQNSEEAVLKQYLTWVEGC